MTSTNKILDDRFLIAIKFDCKKTCASFCNPTTGEMFLLDILPGRKIIE